MFEPVEFTVDELQLAISLSGIDSVVNGHFIALEELTELTLSDFSFDALFVSGVSPEQGSELSQICLSNHIDLVVFDNPANNSAAIRDVVVNLADKLFSKEMPNNVDLADILNLNQSSDYLFAFNNKASALDYMGSQQLGVVVGGIYLAHGKTDLREYEVTNKELLLYFSEQAALCSSFHSTGLSECTILLGIKSQSSVSNNQY